MQFSLPITPNPRPEPPPPAIVARVTPYLEELFGGMHRLMRDGHGRPWLMVDNFGASPASNVAVPLAGKSMASGDPNFGTLAYVLAHKHRLRIDVEYFNEEDEEEHTFCGGQESSERAYYRGLVLRIWDRGKPDTHGWRHPGLDDLIEMIGKMRGDGERP